MKHSKDTKLRIVDAAISLFYTNGFKGASIRDIAQKASANPATISYYFKGKQGLLEACFIRFFEAYLEIIETYATPQRKFYTTDALKTVVYRLLEFQSNENQLARFVWREISLDSQITREITASYLMKERYLLSGLMQPLTEKLSDYEQSLYIIQLKSLITMPYLNAQYIQEVWNAKPQEKYFVKRYYKQIENWIDATRATNYSPPQKFLSSI